MPRSRPRTWTPCSSPGGRSSRRGSGALRFSRAAPTTQCARGHRRRRGSRTGPLRRGRRATRTDPSGNVRLGDVGVVLKNRIVEHFRDRRVDATLKYIDPSYHIRSVPASPNDSVYCWNMARNAVHAALAGNTEVLIGRWHGRFVHVPMPLATRFRKRVDVTGDLWMSVVESTGHQCRGRSRARRSAPVREWMLREMGRRAARVGEGTRRAVQSFRPVTRIVPDDWGSRPGGTDARQRDEPERCHSRTPRVVPQI